MGRVSRRGASVYAENPSVSKALTTTKTRKKRISNKKGDKFMIVSHEGEVMAPAGFHEIIEVDNTQFIKLYAQGVKAFADLSKTATIIFELVVSEMQENIGKDELFISSQLAEIKGINPRTFLRGMKELISKEFLFESAKGGNWYFINVNYFFNGNRLGFLKEYRLKETVQQPNLIKDQISLLE